MKKILTVSFPLGLILLVTGLSIFLVYLFASLVGFLIGGWALNPGQFHYIFIESTGLGPQPDRAGVPFLPCNFTKNL